MTERARDDAAASSERIKAALAWIAVGVPALWAVSQVVVKSLALFR
ncbi:MAG TPA: hypothetical protein VEA99_01065 [Gemmatimonadaceae bacterium]|nr:hypothetical protein [Gemmatimonadaceae bacterium]